MNQSDAPLRALKVLFVASNPLGTQGLSLDEEFRDVASRLRVDGIRERVRLLPRLAARPEDLMEGLLEEEPDIVHFSGQGEANGALVFTAVDGQRHDVSVEALGALFGAVRSPVRMVVLNACFSDPQAQMLAEVVGCAIGMNRPISGNRTADGVVTARRATVTVRRGRWRTDSGRRSRRAASSQRGSAVG